MNQIKTPIKSLSISEEWKKNKIKLRLDNFFGNPGERYAKLNATRICGLWLKSLNPKYDWPTSTVKFITCQQACLPGWILKWSIFLRWPCKLVSRRLSCPATSSILVMPNEKFKEFVWVSERITEKVKKLITSNFRFLVDVRIGP